MRRGGGVGGLAQTKNGRSINGLASCDMALDCVAANNRLKAAAINQPGEFRLAPEIAPTTRIKTIFLTRNEEGFA
jgi:hypothetical protein